LVIYVLVILGMVVQVCVLVC